MAVFPSFHHFFLPPSLPLLASLLSLTHRYRGPAMDQAQYPMPGMQTQDKVTALRAHGREGQTAE